MSMTSAMRNLAGAMMICGTLRSSEALANGMGDIVSIKSEQANTTYTASGSTIDFKITLAGRFQLNCVGGTAALYPEIRMVVNGDVAWATLYSLSQYTLAAGAFDRTDAIFRYTAKPGDMAQPLKLYCTASIPYQFYWNGWEVRNSTTLLTAVWKFNVVLSLPSVGEVFDPDLANANIKLKTLSFDEMYSPVSVNATDAAVWRVTTVNPIGASVVDFYVWAAATNIVQVGSVSGQAALLVSMPTGATFADFQIRGLAVGTTDIYLQRTSDYQNNGILGVTNYIKRTIMVTPPVGFALWATGKGLSGDPDILLGLDRDGDGVANGFEYAFGTNRTVGMPLLKIRIVDGSPLVETPKRDPDTTADVSVTVEGCTNLLSDGWTLPMGPSRRSDKPADRDWYAPLVTVPDKAFFRLRAVRE